MSCEWFINNQKINWPQRFLTYSIPKWKNQWYMRFGGYFFFSFLCFSRVFCNKLGLWAFIKIVGKQVNKIQEWRTTILWLRISRKLILQIGLRFVCFCLILSTDSIGCSGFFSDSFCICSSKNHLVIAVGLIKTYQ